MSSKAHEITGTLVQLGLMQANGHGGVEPAGAQLSVDGNGNTVLVGADGDYRLHLGSVLLRYRDSGAYTSGGGIVGGSEDLIAQTIAKATSGASTPYNYIKWNELVHDDTGETSAIYPATNTDRIIVPAGARLARVNASFAADFATNAVTNISGAANNGSGAIRLTVADASEFSLYGCSATVASVTGTTEANGAWYVKRIDATHIDLIGSTFTNAYVSGGTITGSLGTYRGLRIYGGAAGTTNMGNTKLFDFHSKQSNNILASSAWMPVTPGHILRIGLLQDTVADWVNPEADTASSYFGAEFMA